MRIIALIFMLLSPILAMENTQHAQLYDDRAREGERKITELQQESHTTLRGKKDIIASAKEEIREKCSRFPAPQTFLKELDALLQLLAHPEELLTVEQRRALIGSPCLKYLQPITNIIEFLGNFIKKWQALTAHAEALQLAANQTIWYDSEWTSLAEEMGDKITDRTMLCKDLLKIYGYTHYFHAEGTHLATSYNDLKSTLQIMLTILPEDLSYLDELFNELIDFFHVRGSALWEIIRYSNPVLTAESVRNLTKNYDDLPNDFFLDNANFIKKILTETDPSSKITILAPIRQDHPSPKIQPSHSLSMPRQNPSSLRSQKSLSLSDLQQTHSAPQTRSHSPLSSRKIEKASKTSSAKERLQKTFTQPDQWNMGITAFKEKILLLIHANVIVDPLCRIFNAYNTFKSSCLRNHNQAYDILSPKAHLDIPGQPLAQIPQTLARKVCSLKSNGSLCFDLPECDFETTLAFNGYIANLEYRKRRELYPSETRNQVFQFCFESLFGISSDPVLVGACSNVSFYAPRDTRQRPNPNSCSESYVENPDAWDERQKLDFVTIHRKPKDKLFSKLLNKVAVGSRSFRERLDPNAIGLRILFGFLTQECASPENFEMVQNGKKLSPKRVSAQAFLQPLFMLREDKNHHFIGHNVFYLLPFMDEEIPQDVKSNFESNNIFLYLATALTQLTEAQRDFDSFIQKYKLTEDDDLKDELEIRTKLSKADVLGLTLNARQETVYELIRNFTIIKQQLAISNVTYRQILKALRPLEFNCYEQILENAQRKTLTTPIFFKNVIPSLVNRLRSAYEGMVGIDEIPLYTLEDLNSVERASILYQVKIEEYIKAIDRLNDERIRKNLNKEALEEALADNELNISALREQLISFGSTGKKDAQVQLPEKLDTVISIPEAGIDSPVNLEDNSRDLQRRLEEEIKKKERNAGKLTFIREELKSIDLSLKGLHERLSAKSLFEELQEPVCLKISRSAQAFLENKYKWATENHIFYASVVLKAWEIMFDAEKPLIYENLVRSGPLPDWSLVPMLTQNQLTPVYAQVVESDHPIERMVQDLMIHANISPLLPTVALDLLDRLLTLKPRPVTYHESWKVMLPIARERFLGISPHVRSFLHSLGLQPDEEEKVLQNAHLQSFDGYQGPIKIAISNLEQELTPEQVAGQLFHQLWAGSLMLNQEKDRLFFDGLIKLFSLPFCGSQISAGFAINPESKGGIFDLRYRVGDHYLLTESPEWIKLFNAPDPLPASIRLALLSQPSHLLLLQWLDVLKQKAPGILFHAWYPKTVIGKITLLQEFLQTRLSFTFNEILSTVWPEIHFITQQKLGSHGNDIDLTLKAQASEMGKLTPVEQKGVNLDNRKDGKNMLARLRKRDVKHMRYIATSPLSLDNAATEWVAYINPAKYGPEILALLLNRATRFSIDPSKINSALWNNPKILTNLVSVQAPLECLQQAVALRVGLPFRDISLSLIQRSNSHDYRISGLKGNVALICELIRLFPTVTSLSLADNELRSLSPLVESLKQIPFLTDLSLKDNPIHNPAPLAEFPQLTCLNIENTGIPDVYPKGLKELIAREKRVKVETVRLLEEMKSFCSGPAGVTEKRDYGLLRQKNTLDLLDLIRSYMGLHNPSLEDTNQMICVLELLAEEKNLWRDTLVLETKHLDLPCDDLFGRLQEFDPREVAYKLLFAMKYHLPHGTNRDTLYFVNPVPSMQANCLSRLDISNVCINSIFWESLRHFENLSRLSLVHTFLSNLNDFPILRQLQVLELSNNMITTLLGLHTATGDIKFPNLNVINLTNNKIVTDDGIRFLLELEKLTYINLNNNLLTKKPAFGNLRFLQHLDLDGNKF